MQQTDQSDTQGQPTPESLGQQLRALLPLKRIQSLSIHDRDGDTIWLSENQLGPDEHNVVLEAITVFEVEGNRAYVSEDLGDGRSAAFFASCTPHGELVGMAMVIADSRSIDSLGAAKLVTPKVRSIMQRLAIAMKPPQASAPARKNVGKPGAQRKNPFAIAEPEENFAEDGSAAKPASPPSRPPAMFAPPAMPIDMASQARQPRRSAPPLRSSPTSSLPEPAPGERVAARANIRVDQAAAPAAQPERVVAPPSAPPPVSVVPVATPAAVVAPAATATAAAPMPDLTATAPRTVSDTGIRAPTSQTGRNLALPIIADIALHVQQLMKLRSGGRTRRYEVLVRGRQDAGGDAMSENLVKALSLRETAAAIDRAVVSQLTDWLKQHPHIWNSDPASFSINLSNGSLLDPSFIPFVSQTLQSSGVAPDTIGFEVPEQSFLKHREACGVFMDACEKIGCYVVIDDFSMHSDVVPFLASRALRVVKIDPRLTHSAMRDRLAQALVIAISQSSKVLGLHCVAKRIDSAATRQWLSAVGIDFAQGFVLEDPQPLNALANPAARPPSKPTVSR